MICPLYSVAGLLVGLLVGLTGVGGGSLMTPLLVLAFGFHPTVAVGTDLLYASATKVAGTGVHGIRDTVDWRIVRRLACGSVPAVGATLLALHLAHARPGAADRAVTDVLGVALVLAGGATFFRRRIVAHLAGRFADVHPRRIALLTMLLGAGLGALITLTSVGAGALGMTALLALYPREPLAKLVGSDIAHAVPVALLAGLGHLAMGGVDGGLLLSLLVGSVPGVVAGSLLASRIPEGALSPVLATVLLVVGVQLLAPELTQPSARPQQSIASTRG